MTYTLFLLPFMFKPVVQANISMLISVDSQGLSFPVPNLHIHFCSFYIEIVQAADCFWFYEDMDTKSCTLSVIICQKQTPL